LKTNLNCIRKRRLLKAGARDNYMKAVADTASSEYNIRVNAQEALLRKARPGRK
jgi:hypothetical protein